MAIRNQQQKQQPAKKARKARGTADAETCIVIGTQEIPLNHLHASPLNVRKTGGQKIEDLAASIAAEGLIHNLTVVEAGNGKSPRFEVIAGGRRLKALQALAKQKTIKADHPVSCRIVDAAQATGTSLAENVIREAMHPADQFEAFKLLVDEGRTQTEIAGRFGVTSAVVRDRLALARVAPEVLTLYRANALNLDQVMAFTVSSDHDLQRAVLENKRVPGAWEIKRQLLAGSVTSKDARAVYVGKKAYEAAGGAVRKDLFAGANDEGTFFEDGALLERLALAKLDTEAEPLRATCAWVVVTTEMAYDERSRYGNVPTILMPATPEQAARIAELEAASDAARSKSEAAESDGTDDDAWQALEDASELAFDALQEARAELEQPDPEAAALAGAIVTLNHAGKMQVHTGLVRPEDKAKLASAKKADGRGEPLADADTGPSDPLPVRMGLSALRTAVAQHALAENIDVALRALAFALVNSTFRLSYGASSYGVNVRGADKSELDGACEALAAHPIGSRNAEREAAWKARLPSDDAGLWAWCLAADDNTIRSLLAYCTARTLDGVQRFPSSRDEIGPIAAALGIDMADHWQPTPAYFAKVKKSDTLAALAGDDGKAPTELTKLKRDQLAEEASKRLAGTRWLPPTLRCVG